MCEYQPQLVHAVARGLLLKLCNQPGDIGREGILLQDVW